MRGLPPSPSFPIPHALQRVRPFPLAHRLSLHGASVKLLLFSALLTQAVLPLAELPLLASMAALVLGVLLVTVAVGLVESLTARLAFRRVPLLLTIGFLFCLFPLLLTWMGEI